MGQAIPLSVDDDRLRVILCIAFDRRAPSEKVREFKARIIECPNVLHSVEVSGTFDFMFEAAVPDLTCFHEKLEAITDPLQMLAVRVETNFVCNRNVKPPPSRKRLEETKQAEIWVPCRDGRRKIFASDITAISAERDYVRIHLDGSNCLYHCTMKEILGRLDPEEFIHIHRSVIVRRDLVERLLHETRHWKVRLVDGSVWPIAKSHEREVVGMFTGIQNQPGTAQESKTTQSTASVPATSFMLPH
jgi:DNA-binding LytR/AlgR family response regulator